jgi:predicted enzyme related to lactoylglutathione lyase
LYNPATPLTGRRNPRTDAAAAKAGSLGGTVVAPPHDEPGFRRCVVADPQGAVFSLSQLVGFK